MEYWRTGEKGRPFHLAGVLSGNPYIAYTSSRGEVKLVWSKGGVWQSAEDVDTGSTASTLSLVVDANGLHLSYCDAGGALKYAYAVRDESAKGWGSWNIETVATDCAGSSVSLKLINANTACICYTTSGKLMCVIGQVGSPVRLQQFSARREAGGVRLRWRCSEAADAAGFFLYRAETERGPYARVNSRLLAANTTAFRDRDAGRSGRCYYKLEIVDNAGNRTVYGPERVQ